MAALEAATYRPIVEIEDDDAIFHTVYDLKDRPQIPGQAHLRAGYKLDGIGAHWRGIYDDKGRIMVAITFNSDVGDAWEYADDPYYPEKFSGLAIRVGLIMWCMRSRIRGRVGEERKRGAPRARVWRYYGPGREAGIFESSPEWDFIENLRAELGLSGDA